ncbi:MAG TPA: ISAs1 family transposase [Chloroflexia bacterium]|nr:ISAs1 family transposase [Chloroflexia bacterium]
MFWSTKGPTTSSPSRTTNQRSGETSPSCSVRPLFPPEQTAETPETTTDKQHGRLEIRKIQTSTVLNDFLDFPHVGQVARVERIIEQVTSGKVRTEVVYLITSLSPEEASPERLLALNRGHWEIENRLHWVRDVTFGEDLSQIRKGAGPRMMATLRNLAISLLRLYRKASGIAEALRNLAAQPHLALGLLGL